jgi:hypothetical protein
MVYLLPYTEYYFHIFLLILSFLLSFYYCTYVFHCNFLFNKQNYQ